LRVFLRFIFSDLIIHKLKKDNPKILTIYFIKPLFPFSRCAGQGKGYSKKYIFVSW